MSPALQVDSLPTELSGKPRKDLQFSSVQFSRSVVSNSLRPHESQHTRHGLPNPFIYLFKSGAPPHQKKVELLRKEQPRSEAGGFCSWEWDRPGRHAPQMRKLKHRMPPGPQKEFTAFYLENYTRTRREALWIERDGTFT